MQISRARKPWQLTGLASPGAGVVTGVQVRPVAMGAGPAAGPQTARVFARDLKAPGAARLRRLGRAAGPEGGVVRCGEGVLSDLVVIAGDFSRLRVAVYGFPLGGGDEDAPEEGAAAEEAAPRGSAVSEAGDAAALSELTVAQLKVELQSKGLATAGRKADLVARLAEAKAGPGTPPGRNDPMQEDVEGAAPAPELPGRAGPGGEARDWGGCPPRWVATRAREALAAATELWEEDGEGSMEERAAEVVRLLLEAAVRGSAGSAEDGPAHLNDIAADAAAQCAKLAGPDAGPGDLAGAATGLAASAVLLEHPGGAAAFAEAGGLGTIVQVLHRAAGALGRDPALAVRAGWALQGLEALSRSAAGMQLLVDCRAPRPGGTEGRLHVYDVLLTLVEQGGWHLQPAALRAARHMLRRFALFTDCTRSRKAGRALLAEGGAPSAAALEQAAEAVRTTSKGVCEALRGGNSLGKVLLGEDRAAARANERAGLPHTLSLLRDQGVLDLTAGLLAVPCLGSGGALGSAEGVMGATSLWNEVCNLLGALLSHPAGVQLLAGSKAQVGRLVQALETNLEARFMAQDASSLKAALEGLLAAEGAADAFVSVSEASRPARAGVVEALGALVRTLHALSGASELLRPPAVVLLPPVWSRVVEFVHTQGPLRELSLELVHLAAREGLEDGEFLAAGLPHLEAIVENLERVEGDPRQGLMPGVQGLLKSVLGAVVQAQVSGPRGVQEFTGALVKSAAERLERVRKGAAAAACPLDPEPCAGINAGLAIMVCMAADCFPHRPGQDVRRIPLELLDGNCGAILLDVLLCVSAALRSLQIRTKVQTDASFLFLGAAVESYLRLLDTSLKLSLHVLDTYNRDSPDGAPSQMNKEFLRHTADAYCATFSLETLLGGGRGAFAGSLQAARESAVRVLQLWMREQWSPSPVDELLGDEDSPLQVVRGWEMEAEEEEPPGALYTAPSKFIGTMSLLGHLLPEQWPQVLQLPRGGRESRGALTTPSLRQKMQSWLEPNATALATLLVQASLMASGEVQAVFLWLCTRVASLGENGCLIIASPMVAALQQEVAYTLAAGQDNPCLAALARSVEGLSLSPAPKAALVEAGVVGILLELFQSGFFGAFPSSTGGEPRASVDCAMGHALRTLTNLLDLQVSLSPGAPRSQRTIDDSPPVAQIAQAVQTLLGVAAELPPAALRSAAGFFAALEATPLGLAGLARGAAAWMGAEGEQAGGGAGGEPAGGAAIITRFRGKFPEGGGGEGREGEAQGEAEASGARHDLVQGVVHALTEMEEAEDEIADADELPEGTPVVERFAAAAAVGGEGGKASASAREQAPWIERGQDAPPPQPEGASLLAARVAWTCIKEETPDAAERWTEHAKALQAAAVPPPPAAGACEHWLLALKRAPAVPSEPWPQDGLLGLGLRPPVAAPGAPAGQNLDLGYDDADQFQLGLEDDLQGPTGDGAPERPHPAPTQAANGGAPGGATAAPAAPPAAPAVPAAPPAAPVAPPAVPPAAPAAPGGLSPDALASIMRDPAKLKPLLEKHPELVNVLKARMKPA